MYLYSNYYKRNNLNMIIFHYKSISFRYEIVFSRWELLMKWENLNNHGLRWFDPTKKVETQKCNTSYNTHNVK